MTLSLAAVFIPLVFMPGLLGRIFREFAITIIVAIFASGSDFVNTDAADVSRDSGRARTRTRRTWMETFVRVASFKPMRAFYGRSLDWFLDHGWLAAPIIVACALGVWFFFTQLPFTFCRRATAA